MARPRKNEVRDLTQPCNLSAGAIERLVCPLGKDQAFLRDGPIPLGSCGPCAERESANPGLTRRDLLQVLAGVALGPSATGLASGNTSTAVASTQQAAGVDSWRSGSLAHLLPTVSSDRMLIKTSFHERVAAPRLEIEGRRDVAGHSVDALHRFWEFDVKGLDPSTNYTLRLVDEAGRPLCDPWPLRTFPASSENPERLRLLIFTCAGGHDILGKHLPVATRSQLLKHGLSFKPDAVIANGDHIYWDLKTGRARDRGASPVAEMEVGTFDRDIPILGFSNEAVLKRAVGPQIVPLYGTACRSTPVFFMQDDHDYFENDEADDNYISLPPDPFELAAARVSQQLYYPEFLPDLNRPLGLASASAADRPPGISESFGTLRYGKLLEVLMYDCRRFMTLKGPSATFIPPEAEQWLHRRMRSSDAAHVLNMPSVPPGWSAGKWGEWYADLEVNGKLTTRKPKPYWQSGWRQQHDRILQSISGMPGRVPLVISGDLHAIGETHIHATSGISLRRNPVIAILSGPLGTASNGFPSAKRGLTGATPAELEVDEVLAAREQDGFLIVDFTVEDVTVQFFQWRMESGIEIETLTPFRTSRFKRKG